MAKYPQCSRCGKRSKITALHGKYELCGKCNTEWYEYRDKQVGKMFEVFIQKGAGGAK